MSRRSRITVALLAAALIALSVCAAPSAMAKSSSSSHALRFKVVKRTAHFDIVIGHNHRIAVRHGAHRVILHGGERYRVVRRTHSYIFLGFISRGAAGTPAIVSPNSGEFPVGAATTITWRTSVAVSTGYYGVSLKNTVNGTSTGLTTGKISARKGVTSYSVPWSVTQAVGTYALWVYYYSSGGKMVGSGVSNGTLSIMPAPVPVPTPTPTPTATPTPAGGIQEGVSFTAHSAGAYDNVDAHTALDELRATGATWVMILATAYQDNIASTTIERTASTPSDASLENIIAYAHSIGLKVMLKPQIDLSNDPDHDRASIGSDFSDTDWTTWFASYTSFIIHYATLAAATHCEQFSVGCVLNATVAHEAAWRQVISDVRTVYRGSLTYAANLYTDSPTNPHNVQFWDALDLIGLNMYPTLSEQLEPTVADLVAGWGPVYTRLAQLHTRWNKPLIFTELGIRSMAGAAQSPSLWQGTGAVDLSVQANWYQAALETFAAHSFMDGMFWWEWAPWPTDGGSSDISYTPHGKPAEVILTDWYTNKLR